MLGTSLHTGYWELGYSFPGARFPGARDSQMFFIPVFPGMELTDSRENGNATSTCRHLYLDSTKCESYCETDGRIARSVAPAAVTAVQWASGPWLCGCWDAAVGGGHAVVHYSDH